MFVSEYISTNVFFSKWDFLQKFGEILSRLKLSFGEKNSNVSENFSRFFPSVFSSSGNFDCSMYSNSQSAQWA